MRGLFIWTMCMNVHAMVPAPDRITAPPLMQIPDHIKYNNGSRAKARYANLWYKGFERHDDKPSPISSHTKWGLGYMACSKKGDSKCQRVGQCVKVLLDEVCIKVIQQEKANSTTDDPCKYSLNTCFTHCTFGYQTNTTSGCKVCECRSDPCNEFSCPVGMECTLTRKLCEDPPCGAEAACIPTVDNLGCPVLNGCGVDTVQDCDFGLKADSTRCLQCACAEDPCKSVTCEEGRKCKLEINPCYRKTNQSRCHDKYHFQFQPVCRAVEKPGSCPSTAEASPVGDSHFGGNFACMSNCEDDADCPSIQRCCRSGCGNKCVTPVIDDGKLCTYMREEALESNQTLYTPQCTPDGKFYLIQCKDLGMNELTCFCVDANTGESIGERLPINIKHLLSSCRMYLNRICFEEPGCSNQCEFGYTKDDSGCLTCECKPSPCEEKECPYGKVCQLVHSRRCTYKCNRIAVCLDKSKADMKCPKGSVLLKDFTEEPVTCQVDMYSPRYSSRYLVCPDTHHCVPLHSDSLGYCCPSSKEDEKPGDCPVNILLKHVRSFSYMCSHTCNHDLDCPGVLKCCPTACTAGTFEMFDPTHGGFFSLEQKKEFTACQAPISAFNSTCLIALNMALMSLKMRPQAMPFIPRCQFDGSWQTIQCHDFYGVCWCAHPNGSRMEGTQVRGVPNCDEKKVIGDTDEVVCPPGVPLHFCKLTVCKDTQCAGYPGAVCRVNPCGGCNAEFYDSEGIKVDCKVATQCEVERSDAITKIYKRQSQHVMQSEILAHVMLKHLQEQRSGVLTNVGKEWGSRVSSGVEEAIDRIYRKETAATCPSVNDIDLLLESLDDQRVRCFDMCDRDEDCFQAGAICCPGSRCGHYCWLPQVQHSRCSLRSANEYLDTKQPFKQFENGQRPFWHYDKKTGTCREEMSCLPLIYRQAYMSYDQFQSWTSLLDCERNCMGVYALKGVYIPQCVDSSSASLTDINYETVQCQDGLCWCVNPEDASPVPGTLTKGNLVCDREGPIKKRSSPPVVCQDGSIPEICADTCNRAVCYPTARIKDASKVRLKSMHTVDEFLKSVKNKEELSVDHYTCRADPCNDCKPLFVDSQNHVVECSSVPICQQPRDVGNCHGTTTQWYFDSKAKKCASFVYSGCGGNANRFDSENECVNQCGGIQCDNGGDTRVCDAACDDKMCDTMPEAVCIADPCTCAPRFFHPSTFDEVKCHEQEFSLCERMAADSVRLKLLTDDSDAIHVMECEDDGSFTPLQCHNHHKICWCVDDHGMEVPGSKIVANRLEVSNKSRAPCLLSRVVAIQLDLYFTDLYDFLSSHKGDAKEYFTAFLAKEIYEPKDAIFAIAMHRLLSEDSMTKNDALVTCKIVHQRATKHDLASVADRLQLKIARGELVFSLFGKKFTADSRSYVRTYDGEVNDNLPPIEVWDKILGITSPLPLMEATEPYKDDSNVDRIIIGSVSGCVGVIIVLLPIAIVVRVRRGSSDTKHMSISNEGYDEQTHDHHGNTLSMNGTVNHTMHNGN